MLIKSEHILQWMGLLNTQIDRHKDYLTGLDQAIGDGDHGINMARGLREINNKIHQSSQQDIGKLLSDIGMVLISKVGGASGPLFGTAFMKAAQAVKGKTEISISELGQALHEAIGGIKLRGKSQVGDKTMLDVWEPVAEYVELNIEALNFRELIIYAKEQMIKTKEIDAKKGRAAYLGSRSIGHLDPGAVSSYFVFETLCLAILGENLSDDLLEATI
ncbi:dihydroxyacetone kinase subunit DhaL [Risungbinella massiliensis]|uniref:dihydroxyacetone kinase subunit DhaL n=1 Tax=Risungbinella massiliensis TaxID=1329796 RepID=UPI0005CC5513|nr:dihydroxyacetone kinase subunit DhaL [Risungbinella massiliensis]